MTIYLYKKTHSITGLKYLGKTVSKNPHKYTGSGKYWKNHLEKHGFLYTTEILKECHTIDELIIWGKYYSELWNVVESDEWANLKEEAGPGGYLATELKQRISNTVTAKLAKLTPAEKIERVKRSCCKPESYTEVRSKKISNALTGLQRSETNKINSKKSAIEYRESLSLNDRKIKYGTQNAGKTWKVIDGKRVWIFKEN